MLIMKNYFFNFDPQFALGEFFHEAKINFFIISIKFQICCYPSYPLGWSVVFFLIGQNRSSNQRLSMFLGVKIQTFGARLRMRIKIFILKKFQGV